MKSTRKSKSIVLSILSKDEIINYEDVIRGNKIHQYTIKCSSIEGSAYFIPADEILAKTKNEHSIAEVNRMIQ